VSWVAVTPRRTVVQVPELFAQWDEVGNAGVDPASVGSCSARRVSWRCQVDSSHVWVARVDSRSAGHGCPFCAGRRVAPGSSLADVRPELAEEWDCELNAPLEPDAVRPGSSKVVWWRCGVDERHVWRASVAARTARRGTACPMCARRVRGAGNTLADTHPELACEFDVERNAPVTLADVSSGRRMKVVWRCRVDSSHVWVAGVSERVRGYRSCPHCPRPGRSCRCSPVPGRACQVKRSSRHTRPLTVTHPVLVEQWDRVLNAPLEPGSVTAGSSRRVWWRCSTQGHVWCAPVSRRTSHGSGCPYCSGLKVVRSRSLAVLRPDLAAEFDVVNNAPLSAQDVSPGSSRQVWWVCSVDSEHRWRSPVVRRTGRGADCPLCSGRMLSPERSVATVAPWLVAQWADVNAGSPQTCPAGSKRSVTWVCPRNGEHRWVAQVSNRVRGGDCPFCHVVSRSRVEIAVAAELSRFVDVDLSDGVVVVDAQRVVCDIVLRDSRVVVEYDGGFWHAGSLERDVAKSALLESDGWRVMRLREVPLPPAGVSVSVPPGDVFAAACAALGFLERCGAVGAGVASRYRSGGVLVAQDVARRWVAEHMVERRSSRRYRNV
jgi:hypothetical protein